LKGIQVSPEYGKPFLSATQVFDLRPTHRKWLSVHRIVDADELQVGPGAILVTRSGAVGRAIIAHATHTGVLISDDLLRVIPRRKTLWGWLYAFLRSSHARAMMTGLQYGHVIKHLECSHLDGLPVPLPDAGKLEHFNTAVKAIYEKRDRAHELVAEAEAAFDDAVGEITPWCDDETGFVTNSRELSSKRRGLDAAYHTPRAIGILYQFARRRLETQALSELAERIWWMPRFRRVFGEAGAPYMSAEELFTINPPHVKRVLVEQADNAAEFFVKAGWIVMACSGQTYGLLGSAALMTRQHERAFLSHDLIRIVPARDRVHPGYLLAALSHPKLGRPLIVRHAYGTSIPHLEPADIATVSVVRLGPAKEAEIGDRMQQAAELRTEADDLERSLTAEAEEILNRCAPQEQAG
jgi:hypothetical protein